MRHGFAITRFATVVAFAVGQWSTTYADSSFKLVTAPSDAKQAPTMNEHSSVVIAQRREASTGATDPDAKKAQGKDRTTNVPREQILLPPNTQRQVSFTTPFTKVVVSNPDVLGVLPIGSHSIVVKAIKTGNSDILFFNNEKLVRSLEVIVDDSIVRRSAVPDHKALIFPTNSLASKIT